MTFAKFSTCVYHQHANTFCPILHKNIINFWNTTTPRNFVINTIWVNVYHNTSTPHWHPKWLKPTEISLFNILPTDILTDIDIWVSGLEHCDKFKAFIKNMNTMCNPTIFSIPPELWSPYHNLSVYSCFYPGVFYKWAYRRIPTNTCLCYQFTSSYSTGISKLIQHHIEFHESVVACQHINWDKNSSIPYFKQKIPHSYVLHHATCDTPDLPAWRPRWTCCPVKYGIYYLFYSSPRNFVC